MGSRSRNRNRNRQCPSESTKAPGDATQWTYSRPRAAPPTAPPRSAKYGKPPNRHHRHVQRQHVPESRSSGDIWFISQACMLILPVCLMALRQIGPEVGITVVAAVVAFLAYWNIRPPAQETPKAQPARPQEHKQQQYGSTQKIPIIFYAECDGIVFAFLKTDEVTTADFFAAWSKAFDLCHGKGATYIRNNFTKFIDAELAAMKTRGNSSNSSNSYHHGNAAVPDQHFMEWQQQQGPLRKQFEAAAAAQPNLEGLSSAELRVFLQQAGVQMPLAAVQHHVLITQAQSCTQAWECKRLQRCGELLQQHKHNHLLRLQVALCALRVGCIPGELPTAAARRCKDLARREWLKLVRIVHPDKAVSEQEQHRQLCEDAFKVLAVAYELVDAVQ